MWFDLDKLKYGMILSAVGIVFLFIGKILSAIDLYLRGRSDARSNNIIKDIVKKETEVNEASKNSTNSVSEYERLKGEYDKK